VSVPVAGYRGDVKRPTDVQLMEAVGDVLARLDLPGSR
jgi:hypothetical protein